MSFLCELCVLCGSIILSCIFLATRNWQLLLQTMQQRGSLFRRKTPPPPIVRGEMVGVLTLFGDIANADIAANRHNGQKCLCRLCRLCRPLCPYILIFIAIHL
jgi:hypothetical protein